MKKTYCTRNNGDCSTCNLVNYGLDCANNPLPQTSHKVVSKFDRAMAAYTGFKGGQTIAHVQKLVGKELADRLTGHDLGLVMSAVDRAFHEGKASAGAEMIDSNCVWVNGLDKAIEWNEVGAEYKRVDIIETLHSGATCKVNKAIKIKDGKLVLKWSGEPENEKEAD